MRWFAPLRKDNQLLMASEKVELIKLDIYWQFFLFVKYISTLIRKAF
jgi:hypothetical protein